MDKKLKTAITLNGHKLSTNGISNLTATATLNANSNIIATTTSSSPLTWKSNQTTKEPHKRNSIVTQQQNSGRQQRTTTSSITAATSKHLTSHEAIPQRSLKNSRNSSNFNKNSSVNVLTKSQILMTPKATACIATPMDQLTAIHAKVTSGRNKNEEAIHDLRSRIPEIENIFDIHSRIGNGTFSTVLLGTLKKERDMPDNQRRKFAIKHHIPTSHPDRIMKELQCMAKIGGSDNVVGINCCIRYNESVAFIMPYLAHDRFHDFYSRMDVAETQFYLKNLLIALRHVHRFNVIHRDVKPSNFLYNRRKRQFLLVDFGLAQQVPSAYTGLSNSIGSKFTNLCLPPPSNMALEGKRARDQEECEVKAHNDSLETVSGIAKRLRCSGPQGDQKLLVANGSTQSGLKQQLPTSNNNNSLEYNSTPVTTRQSKSMSTTSRPSQRIRHQGGADVVPAEKQTNSTTTNIATSVRAASPAGSVTESKYNTNRNLSAANNNSKCFCYGNPQVCNICLVKKEIHASRAGTPGYRPPEVLLKYPDQTTAVDVWAAGVIFLSILSSVYPFFKAPNDYVALAEMVTIFGDKTIRKTAFILDRLVTLSQKTKPLDLRKLCVRFRNRAKFSSPELLKKYQRVDGTCEVCKNCDQFYFNCLCMETHYATEPLDGDDVFPASAYDLLYKLLEVNPHKRITAEEALRHPFFKESFNKAHTNVSLTKQNSSALTLNLSATAPLLSKTDQAHRMSAPMAAAAGDSPKKSHK